MYPLLQRIRQRPAMYLGEDSYSALMAFIAGYNYAFELVSTLGSKVANSGGSGFKIDLSELETYVQSMTGASLKENLERYPKEAQLDLFFYYLSDWEDLKLVLNPQPVFEKLGIDYQLYLSTEVDTMNEPPVICYLKLNRMLLLGNISQEQFDQALIDLRFNSKDEQT